MHKQVDGYDIGKHPLVSAAMKGISNLRPPKPKNCFTYDVGDVLKYLSSLHNKDISLRLLTFKTATLLGLASASRCSDLVLLNTRYFAPGRTNFVFYFDKKGKKGIPKPLTFVAYKNDPNLCPVKIIWDYLERTASFRSKSGENFFLSHLSPYEGGVPATVARWGKETLKLAGVNTSVYTGHSL